MKRHEAIQWIPEEGTQQQRTDPYGQSYTLRINSTGQRGGEVGDRQPDERRILFLGDSFTIGTALQEEDLFVTQVGSMLQKELTRPLLTLNGGVDGYNTFQELVYYQYYGQRLDPDVVILCFFMGNDFRDNAVRTDRGRSLSPVLVPPEVRAKYQHLEDLYLRDEAGDLLRDPVSGGAVPKPASSGWTAVQESLLLCRLIGGRSQRLWGKLTDDLWLIDLDNRYYFYEIGQYQRQRHPETKVAMDLTLDLIAQVHRMVGANGAEFMVVLLPSQNQVDEASWRRTLDILELDEPALGSLDKRSPFRMIAEFCSGRGIPCLDLFDSFAEAERTEDLYLTVVQDPHFSPEGHTLVATTMADFILKESSHLQSLAVTSFHQAQAHAARREMHLAEQSLRKSIVQMDQWSAPYVALGDLYREAEHWVGAEPLYRRGLELEPESWTANGSLGEVMAARGNREEAVAAYRRALALRPWWPYQEELRRLYLQAGRKHEAAEIEREIETLFAAPEEQKLLWWIEHMERGDDFSRDNRWPEAEQEFTWALKFLEGGSDVPATLLCLGVALKNQQKRTAALDAFEQAVALDSTLSEARMGIALVHAQAGDDEKAIAVLEQAVRHDPDWVDLWINLGAFYARSGAVENARRALTRALKLAPDHPKAQSNMRSLDRASTLQPN